MSEFKLGWVPRQRKWPWRDFLTEDEVSEVRDLERRIESARYELAQTIPALNPIRNRAIQRAKYAALRAHILTEEQKA